VQVKDTPAPIERKFTQMLLRRSGAERLKMGCSMYATARALAKAALLQQHPTAGPAELKRLLFFHFYGAEFEPEERNRIAATFSKRSRSAKASSARVNEIVAPREKGRARVAESSVIYRTRRLAKRKD
jgi:hypothetical protein